jgi:uncharacterized protein (TIGR00255 family)
MVLSMTGFSSRTSQISRDNGTPLQVNITLKALNARFFETSCRIPHAFNYLELPCTKLLKEKLVRGSIYCTINVSNLQGMTVTVTPATQLVKGYLKALEIIKQETDISGQITLTDLLTFPDIFEKTETPLDEAIGNKILALLEKTAEDLTKSRQTEGAALAQDLQHRLTTLKELLQKIEPRSQAVFQERKTKILTTLQALVPSAAETPEQSLPFLYSQLEKLDIHEELVRLKVHIQSFQDCLSSQEVEKGKKLDFITQELMREITTLTAKAGDAQLSSFGIAFKVELEKMREQVQNIL